MVIASRLCAFAGVIQPEFGRGIQRTVGNGGLRIIKEDDPDIFYRDRP